MCTYNGERYLQQQLDSIFSQDQLPQELVICDDGSTDSTLSIIRQFIGKSPVRIRLVENALSLGVAKNFSQCMALCENDYIALCDQDDIWKKDRLSEQVRLLLDAEKSLGVVKPLLVYSDLELIDGSGMSMGTTFFKHSNLRPVGFDAYRTFAVLNIAPGCGMMINRSLADLALPISDNAVMHDWWLALIASVAGEVIFSDTVGVEYRQHSGNLRGSSDDFRSLVTKLSSPLNLLRKQKSNYASSVHQFFSAMAVLDRHGIPIPGQLLAYRDNLVRGGIHTILPLMRSDISRQGFLRSLSYFSGLCLNFNNRSLQSCNVAEP